MTTKVECIYKTSDGTMYDCVYKTSDGIMYDEEWQALKAQADIDFSNWYFSNPIVTAGQYSSLKDVKEWLMANREPVLTFLGKN